MTLPRSLPAPLDDPWPDLDVAAPDHAACLLGWALVVTTGLVLGAGGAWLALRRWR